MVLIIVLAFYQQIMSLGENVERVCKNYTVLGIRVNICGF